MIKFRLIPLLVLENNRLVKTINFKNPKYIGDPLNSVKIFNDKEVDELIIVDKSAHKNGINFNLIKTLASECFVPITYGGGIGRIEDVEEIIKSGVEKIILRSALFNKPNLLNEIVKKFGNQAVVACFDFKKSFLGHLRLVGLKKLNFNLLDKIKEVTRDGVGEIMLQSVEHDGKMIGGDEEIIKIAKQFNMYPIIYAGGIGSLNDISKVASAGINAVAVGSLFVFKGKGEGVLINYPSKEELAKLNLQI